MRREVKNLMSICRAALGVVLIAYAGVAQANEHGPVFGLATPTNVKGGWSLDIGTMDRIGSQSSGVMTRAMLTYGITEDLQISVSGPAVFSATPLQPARVTAMMPANGDFEALGAWRFLRRDNGVGSRLETTAYFGLIVPGFQTPPGMLGQLHKAPGAIGMIATGYASRKNYFWVGIGGTHFAESQVDRKPGLLSYSVVWGYRPKPLRRDYPHWDGRFFIEMNGEDSGHVLHNGTSVSGTSDQQVFLGPTTLWLYKKYGIEGGVQFPVYQNTGPVFQRERLRAAVDFSYFF
ncbi:MAG TPA: hypothetical protein VNE63_12075 [Candidatus Acidoferrales bacterium]|nr:hypothetical protein [Candidatus Acidoferrales bacterium]